MIKNSQEEVLIASRMIEGFRTIFEVFRSEKHTEIWRSATSKKGGIAGIYEIKALHAFIANPDDHYGNDGTADNPDSTSKTRIAAMVDTGRSMCFKKKFSFLSWTNDLNHIHSGDEISPADLLRVRVGSHYQMPVEIFLNSEYAAALRAHYNKYIENKDQFNHMLKDAVDKLKFKVSPKKLKEYARKVGDSDDLYESLKGSFEKQAEKIREHADHLEVQMLLEQNEMQKLAYLMAKKPHLYDAKIPKIVQGGAQETFSVSGSLGDQKVAFEGKLEKNKLVIRVNQLLKDGNKKELAKIIVADPGILEKEFIIYSEQLDTGVTKNLRNILQEMNINLHDEIEQQKIVLKASDTIKKLIEFKDKQIPTNRDFKREILFSAAKANGISVNEIKEYARHLRTTSRIYNRDKGNIEKSRDGKIACVPEEAHNQAMKLFDGLGADDAAAKNKKQLLVLAVGLEMKDQSSKTGFASFKQTVGNFFRALGNAFKSKESKVTSEKVLQTLEMDRQELAPVIQEAQKSAHNILGV